MLAAKLFNIEAGQPFAKTLARYLLQKTENNPEKLTRYKILLPTRRACRVMRDSFLSQTGGKPLLLPQMTPLGDVEEEDLALMAFGQSGAFLDIPQAISPLRRQLLLARLIMAMPEFSQGHDHALALAEALSSFLDHMIIEELDFETLQTIVPEEFAAHWQITLDFLKILTRSWPDILRENNVIDPAQRRNLLLHALRRHWHAHPPDGPVIAAGSTGSIPATARLLSVIAEMPEGMIVLPGLDRCMDEKSWAALSETHPQYGLKQLLERIGVPRTAVLPLNGNEPDNVRVALASQMMRPAETTAVWKEFGKEDISPMVQGLRYYACDTQQEEAQVIAVIMREALEEPEKTVALITPDRVLARRVTALCKRWGVLVDDSAGQGFPETQVGKFLLLLLQAARPDYDPVALLSMLKHPFCRVDHKMLSLLETSILRQDKRPQDWEELKNCAQDDNDSEIRNFVQHILTGIEIIQEIGRRERIIKFPDLLNAHIRAAEFFASAGQKSGCEILWRGDDGNAASIFLSDLQEHAHLIGDVSYEDYIHIFAHLSRNVTVRSSYGLHPRVMILGQLEARLIEADIVIMGGLNEGSWPPSIRHDPWMSRPMRQAFGMPPLDRATGMAAHDFVQGFCARDVVMTRSRRVDGAPAVPARWLERLDTVMQAGGRALEELSQGAYVVWAEKLNDHDAIKPCERPGPKPPIEARPQGVSVTKVETWLQDPYAIYAYYVLNLRKTKPLSQESDAALRGQILHKILEEFAKNHPYALPENASEVLKTHAQAVLREMRQKTEDMNFWWPRFERSCEWFLTQEAQWRTRAKFIGAELKGEIVMKVGEQDFRLYGMADRIDRIAGGYAIIDYKTGGNFSPGALKEGKLPQLPLEALILEKGRFEGKDLVRAVEPGPSAYLGYWKLSGGQMAGEIKSVEGEIGDIVQKVEEGLKDLVAVFQKPETPYLCIPDAANAPRFNDYEHLSRLKEWAALDDAGEEAA